MRGYLRLFVSAAFVLSFAMVAVAQSPTKPSRDSKIDEQSAKLRKYGEGPLTAADFQATPPEPSIVKHNITIVANTMCVVRYSYRLRTNSERDGTWTARLTSFECFSAIEPHKCWNRVPESSRVLDHEQGHFDLAEIFAQRLQQRFDALMADNKAANTGSTERVARVALESDLKEIAEQSYKLLAEAQATYDKETAHGTRPRAQREHRRWQRDQLNGKQDEPATQ